MTAGPPESLLSRPLPSGFGSVRRAPSHNGTRGAFFISTSMDKAGRNGEIYDGDNGACHFRLEVSVS